MMKSRLIEESAVGSLVMIFLCPCRRVQLQGGSRTDDLSQLRLETLTCETAILAAALLLCNGDFFLISALFLASTGLAVADCKHVQQQHFI